MRSLGVIGAVVLLAALGLAAVAGRAIIQSLTRLAETADDLARDLETAGEARDRAERAGRACDAQLAAIVDQATVGIAQADLDGRFMLVNERYCDLAGCAPDAVMGLSFPETVPVADRPRAAAALRGLTVDAPEAVFETRHAQADGSLRWVAVSLSLAGGRRGARDPSRSWPSTPPAATRPRRSRGPATSSAASCSRASGRPAQEAEAASQAKDEFLAVVSHELRTPLNTIRLWAGVLRDGPRDAQTIARAVDTIDRSAILQARLIEDLLDVSRIVSGRFRLAIERVDLAAIIEPAIETVRAAAEQPGHHADHRARSRDRPGARRCDAAAAGGVEPPVERGPLHAGRRPRDGGAPSSRARTPS